MPSLLSAGLLMCRITSANLEYFLVHPGGPYFSKKDIGVWSVPKGLPNEGEGLLETAQREFTEETGISSSPPYYPLGSIRQKGGKLVHAWAFLGDWDSHLGIKSNKFTLEWPPRSKIFKEFPEQDKAEWMSLARAQEAIIQEQIPFLHKAKEFFLDK